MRNAGQNLDPLREAAKRVGTEAGRASADARGLDDWDDTAEQAAVEAERKYLESHTTPTFNTERAV